MNDEEIEARLARWQPADAPHELRRRLRAAEPPERAARWSWPLAYAGLSVAWIAIFILWLTTTPGPLATAPLTAGQPTATLPPNAPAFASTLAAERRFILSRNNPDQL